MHHDVVLMLAVMGLEAEVAVCLSPDSTSKYVRVKGDNLFVFKQEDDICYVWNYGSWKRPDSYDAMFSLVRAFVEVYHQ